MTYVYVVTEKDSDPGPESGEAIPVRAFTNKEAAEAYIAEQEATRWAERIVEEQLEFEDEADADSANPFSWEWHLVPLWDHAQGRSA